LFYRSGDIEGKQNVKKQRRDDTKRGFFQIKIFIPNSERSKELIIEDVKENLLVSELMNMACFNSKYMTELDANFISIYNKDSDEFDYHIQRLCGFEMNETHLWVPYINCVREDWTDICQNNRILFKNDDLEFRYEKDLN